MMKTHGVQLSFAFIIGLLGHQCTSVVGAKDTSENVVLSNDELAAKIDAFVQKVVDCYSSPGMSLAVVKGGQTIISHGYGHTTAKKNVQTTSTTKFAIGSLTKAFTSLLTVKAVVDWNKAGRSKISLDTPISQYHTDFRVTDDMRSSQATLRDLLSHRMAIPRYTWPLVMGFEPSVNRAGFVRRMAFLHSDLSFREKFIYNNYIYVLVADVLEHLTDGKVWEDLVRETIFGPLGMMSSGFVTKTTDFENFGLPCYKSNGSIFDLSPDLFNTAYPLGPAGTIYSTADDMVPWMNLMLSQGQRASPPGIEPDMAKQTFEAGSLSNLPYQELTKPEFPVSFKVLHYGLGWLSAVYRGYRQMFHSGGIVTHSSRLWLYPDLDIGIFAVARGPRKDGKRDMLQSIMYYVSDILLGETPWINATSACQDPAPWKKQEKKEEEEEEEKADKEESEDHPFNITKSAFSSHYAGNYSHPFFGTVCIYMDCVKDQLCFNYGRYGSMTLAPVSKTKFQGQFYGPLSYMNSKEGNGIMIVFSLDDAGHATSLTFDSKDDVISFERMEARPFKVIQENGHESAHQTYASLVLIAFCVIIFLE